MRILDFLRNRRLLFSGYVKNFIRVLMYPLYTVALQKFTCQRTKIQSFERSLLIIKPSSLGDIIHGLQVAQSIKDQMPGVIIDWVVAERFAPVVKGCSAVDNVMIYHRGEGLRTFIGLIREIRKVRYDYVMDFQGLARTGVMTFFARSGKKLGRRDAREGAGFFYDKKVKMPSKGKEAHAVDILLGFLPEIGLEEKLYGEVRYDVDEYLPKGMHPIVMIPSSRQSRKEWHGFEGLTRKIFERYPNEKVVWDSHIGIETPLEFRGDERFINTTGKTGIREMISIVGSSRLVIANDSGPMHIAAAMGKCVLGIFGPTSVGRFGPYPRDRGTNFVIEAPGGDLKRLLVEEVFDKVVEILGQDLDPGPVTVEGDFLGKSRST